MKQTTLLIGLLVLVLALTGCSVQQPVDLGENPIVNVSANSNIVEIYYQTYGGFTMPETNKQSISLMGDTVDFVIAGYDDSITFNYSAELENDTFDYFVDLLERNDVSSWNETQTADVNIADVGAAKLVVMYSDGANKTIVFDPNVPREYGSDKESVLNALSEYRSQFWQLYAVTRSAPTDDSAVTVMYQPMQCDVRPWDTWYEESDIRFIKAPTKEELIGLYYSEQGIYIRSIVKIESGNMTCEACSVCETSYYYKALIDEYSVEYLENWSVME